MLRACANYTHLGRCLASRAPLGWESQGRPGVRGPVGNWGDRGAPGHVLLRLGDCTCYLRISTLLQ